MPADPNIPPQSGQIDRILARIAELERTVDRLRRPNISSHVVYGDRSDAPYSGGQGPRVRFGLQDDGKVGVRVYNADGTVAYDWTAP